MFKHKVKQIKHVGIVSFIYLFLIFGIGLFVGRQPESRVLGPLVMLMGASGGVLNNYRRLQQLPVTSRKLSDSIPIPNIDKSEESQELRTIEDDSVANTDQSEENQESRIIKKSRTIKSSLVSQTNEQEEEFMSQLFIMRIYLSPVIGAFFAYIVYLVFVGGLVQGSMFPEFQCVAVAQTAEELESDDYCHNYKNFYSFGDTVRPITNKDMAKLLIWGFIAGFAEGLIPSLIDNMAKDAFQRSEEETKISEEKAPKNRNLPKS